MRKKNEIAEKLEKLSKEKGSILLPAFTPKRPDEIKEEPLVQPGPSGKPVISSIKDLAVPESALELFTLEVTTDPSEEERVTQLLGLREEPDMKVTWTALKDADSHEFELLKIENLLLVKSYLPMYGRKFPEGSVLVSHQGDYTFSMASRDIKIDDLVHLFEYGLECAWKFELKV